MSTISGINLNINSAIMVINKQFSGLLISYIDIIIIQYFNATTCTNTMVPLYSRLLSIGANHTRELWSEVALNQWESAYSQIPSAEPLRHSLCLCMVAGINQN